MSISVMACHTEKQYNNCTVIVFLINIRICSTETEITSIEGESPIPAVFSAHLTILATVFFLFLRNTAVNMSIKMMLDGTGQGKYFWNWRFFLIPLSIFHRKWAQDKQPMDDQHRGARGLWGHSANLCIRIVCTVCGFLHFRPLVSRRGLPNPEIHSKVAITGVNDTGNILSSTLLYVTQVVMGKIY